MQRLSFVIMLFLLVSCKSKKDAAQEGDNWVLTKKTVYTYKLNAIGLADTVFVKSYKYANLNLKDSVEAFTVDSYDGSRVAAESSFLGKATSGPQLVSQTKYTYLNDKLLTSVRAYFSGVLTRDQKFIYDTSGKLLSSVVILLKNFDRLSQVAGDTAIPKDSLMSQGYDTLNVTYKYDVTNKNIGGDFMDNRGHLIRRDINIYSGNAPISSFNLGPKGDTIQRITYQQTGNVTRTQSENDDFVIVTAVNSGYMIGKLTFDKKQNKKIKQDWSYDSGRMTEEHFYVDEKGNVEK